MNQPPASAPPRYEFLDALRGYAILGVISYHCAYFSGWSSHGIAFTEAGAFGVQLFFMVSAFTIFMTLERGVSREPALVQSFFIKRILRIVPLFWIGIVLYAFAPGREHYYQDWNIGLLVYFLTAILQQGWHPNYINTVVPGGWSIAIEVSFYIIAPLLFFRIKNWRTALCFFLGTLLLCRAANEGLRILENHRLIFQQVLPDLSRRFAYQWLPSQLPVFACGILTYYILKSVPESFRSKQNGLLLLAVALAFLYSIAGIGDRRLIPEHVFFALGYLPFILALAIYPLPLLVNPAICYLGRISYSCYLMHFVIMQGVIPHLDYFSGLVDSHSFKGYVLLFAASLALTIAVSWLTYNLIEQPFIRLGSYLARRVNTASEPELKNRMPSAVNL
jgi:peptidoglycan/LPS O-acetylase OafA/YrhL